MAFVIAFDQGTTSSRAIVFDEHGAIRSQAQQEFTQHFPRPGWVEHDPVEIWHSQRDVAAAALARADLAAADISALAITNQRETTLLWDRRDGSPLYRAIVWQDRRTADYCERLKRRGLEERVRAKTHLVLDPYFSGTKLAWLLDNVPGARERAERGELAFGTVDSWLIWQLTGGAVHVTDHTNACRTLLYNLHTGDWDDELLALFNIPRAVLPEIVASSGVLAHTAADLYGAAIPIAGIAGDQQAALYGQACLRPGMAKNTYGTGCFMLLHTGAECISSQNGLISSRAGIAAGSPPEYCLEGSVFIAGAVVQWLRDQLGVIRAAPEVEALAASVEDSDGVYFVPAFAGLGAPHWDPHARGALFGVTRGTSSAHIARAALESVAFQSADVLLAMEQDAGLQLAELRVDGGATANNLMMQFQADLLGVPVVRPVIQETTALGAAYLAGLATSVWRSADEVEALWQREREFIPAMSRDEAQNRLAAWRRAVECARGWTSDRN